MQMKKHFNEATASTRKDILSHAHKIWLTSTRGYKTQEICPVTDSLVSNEQCPTYMLFHSSA